MLLLLDLWTIPFLLVLLHSRNDVVHDLVHLGSPDLGRVFRNLLRLALRSALCFRLIFSSDMINRIARLSSFLAPRPCSIHVSGGRFLLLIPCLINVFVICLQIHVSLRKECIIG